MKPSGAFLGKRNREKDAKDIAVIIKRSGAMTTASSTLIGGSEWEYAGDMTIDANLGSDTTLYVLNDGGGAADLDVERNIVLGGTIDGVDLVNFNAASFVTLGTSGYMPNERILTAGDGIDLTDGGAGNPVSVAVDVTDIIDTNYGLTEDSNNIRVNLGTGLTFSAGATVLSWSGLPGTIECDDSAVAGSSLYAAHGDHQHAIFCAAPGADSVNVSASTEGSSASFPRADHTHNLDEGITPTWTAEHTFQADIQLDANLDFVGGQSITTTSGDLTLDPASDVYLPNSDLFIATTYRVHWRNANLYINSSVDGQLDIDADGEVEISAPTIHLQSSTLLDIDSDTQIDGDLTFVGAQQITTTADALTLAPAGDLHLNPGGQDVIFAGWGSGDAFSSSDYVSQTTGWAISYGASGGHADFRSAFFDELHVLAFIADIYQAIVGGLIITPGRGRLSRDFTVPADTASGTIYLEDLEGWEDTQLFTAGDYVRLRHVDTSGGGLIVTDVWGTVTAYSNLSGGEQSWTFTTDDDGGVNGEVVYTGAIALGYGQSGSGSRGVWEATVLDAAGAPYSQVKTWETNPWTGGNWTTHVRSGNLDGLAGVGLEYGLYAGQGLAVDDAFILVSDSQVDLHNLPLTIHDGVNTRIKLDPAGPYLGIGGTAPTSYLGADGIWFGNDSGIYKAHVGDVSGGALVAGWSWDGAALNVIGDLVIGPGLGFAVDNALAHFPFDGPRPYETDYQVNVRGHLGQNPELVGGVIGRPGRFGKGVQLGQAVTNLVENPSFEGSENYWSATGDDEYDHVTDDAVYGSKCGHVYDTLGGSSYIYNAGSGLTVSQGTTHTFSAYVKGTGDSVGETVTIYLREAGGAQASASSSNSVVLTAAWQWIDVSRTIVETDRTALNHWINCTANDDGWYVDGVQLEQETDATPYCDGSLGDGHDWDGADHASTSTRAAAQLKLDDYAADLFQPQGSMSGWLVPQWSSAVAANHSVFDWRDDGSGDRLFLNIRPDSKFDLYVAAAYRITNVGSGSLSAGDHIFWCVTWDYDGGDWKLYIREDDGTLYTGSYSGSETYRAMDQMNVGSNYLGGTPCDGMIDDLLIVDRVLSDDEVDALYLSGAPVQVRSNNFELMLTGEGLGKVVGHAGGLFGWDATGAEAFALPTGAITWSSQSLAAGDLMLGQTGTDNANLLYDQSMAKLAFRINTDEYITFDDSGARITGALLIPAGGSIQVGSGVKDSTLTGFIIDDGEMAAQSSGTDQVTISGADGKLRAGGGIVVLDSGGIDVEVPSGYADLNAYTLIDSGSNTIGGFFGQVSGGDNYTKLETVSVAGRGSYMFVFASAPTSEYISAQFSVNKAGSPTASLVLVDNAANAVEAELSSDGPIYMTLEGVSGDFSVRDSGETDMFKIENTGDAYFYHDVRIKYGLAIGSTSADPSANSILLTERTSDPTAPAEGQAVMWMSDGSGKGDDGDVLIASTAGGSTKYTIVHDHSAGASWS